MPELPELGTEPYSSRNIRRYALILLVIALSLAAWGEISRVLARSSLVRETAGEAALTVVTIRPNRTELGEELVLPGTVQAYAEAPIYARTNGYPKGSVHGYRQFSEERSTAGRS